MCKSSAAPLPRGYAPKTLEVHEHFREKQIQDAPRPYPMTKIENGYPWHL